MDDDGRATGSPLLDLIAARRREPAAGHGGNGLVPGNGSARVNGVEEPEPEAAPPAQEGPLVVAARRRKVLVAAGVRAGVLVSADGAPGRLHALHRRKTRGTATAG